MAAKKVKIAADWMKATTRTHVLKTRQFVPFEAESLPDFINVREASEILKCEPKSVSTYHRARGLRMHKVGGRWKTTREWIADYLNGAIA